jgi:hypothetical protein
LSIDIHAFRSLRQSPSSPVNFQWDDPFKLDEQLTEDNRVFRGTARAYAQDKLLPRVAKASMEEKFDRDILNEMGKLGLPSSISAQAKLRRARRQTCF